MSQTLPAALSLLGQDGNFVTLLKAGAQVPAQAKATFATQRPSQREMGFELYEGEGSAKEARLIGRATVELPPGLPPNTWMHVFFDVREDLKVRIEVKENLRRIRISADLDDDGRKSQHYT